MKDYFASLYSGYKNTRKLEVLTNKSKNCKKGTIDDKARVLESFENVVRNRKRIVCKHLPMYLSSQLFDYLGTIVKVTQLWAFYLVHNFQREWEMLRWWQRKLAKAHLLCCTS